MKKILALLLLVLPALAVADVTIGMTETQLIALKGKPEGKTVVGAKSIYQWPDMVVNLKDSKVVKYTARDTVKEKAMDEQRRKNSEIATGQKKALAAKDAATKAAIAEHTRIADEKAAEAKRLSDSIEAERLQKEQQEQREADERSRMRRLY